jgi:hypothetical protein
MNQLRRHPLLVPRVAAEPAHTMVGVRDGLTPVAPSRGDCLTRLRLCAMNLLAVVRSWALPASESIVLTPDTLGVSWLWRTYYFRDLLHRLLLEGSRFSRRTHQLGATIVHVILSQSAAALADIFPLQFADRVTPGGSASVKRFYFLHVVIVPLGNNTINSDFA